MYLQMHCEFPNTLKMAIHFFSSKGNSIRVVEFLSVMSANFALFCLRHEVVPGGAVIFASIILSQGRESKSVPPEY
jgi:hypothetical protein